MCAIIFLGSDNMINKIVYSNEGEVFDKRKIDVEVGKKIRAVRKKKGISIVSLADKIDTSVTYISQIEKGEYGISLYKFILLSYFLDIDIKDFFQDYIKKFNDEFCLSKFTDKNLSVNFLDFLKNN